MGSLQEGDREMRIFIIGAGSAGASMALGFHKAGHSVQGISDIDEDRATNAAKRVQTKAFARSLPREIMSAEAVVVAVPDPLISHVASRAVEMNVVDSGQVWLHLSGAFGADELGDVATKARGVAALHPATVFAPGVFTEIPPDTVFAIDGNCQDAWDAAAFLGKSLGGKTVHVPSALRPLYHASTVLASNCVVALLGEARALLVKNGLLEKDAEEIAVSLGKSAIMRADAVGLDASLSGPIQRGNVGTVERHLDALRGDLDHREIYAVLGRATLRLACRNGSVSETERADLEKRLNDYSTF